MKLHRLQNLHPFSLNSANTVNISRWQYRGTELPIWLHRSIFIHIWLHAALGDWRSNQGKVWLQRKLSRKMP